MKRVEGSAGVKLIECVSPARNGWRIRWDVQERGDGSASYMEEEFLGKPSDQVIRSVVLGWYNAKDKRSYSLRFCLRWHAGVAVKREPVQL